MSATMRGVVCRVMLLALLIPVVPVWGYDCVDQDINGKSSAAVADSAAKGWEWLSAGVSSESSAAVADSAAKGWEWLSAGVSGESSAAVADSAAKKWEWLSSSTTSIGTTSKATWGRFHTWASPPSVSGVMESLNASHESFTSSNKKVLYGAVVTTGAVIAGGVATPLVVLGAVNAAGFGAGGIAAGSVGASAMSASATGWAWILPAVSTCQSIGATASLGAGGSAAWAAGGGALSYLGVQQLIGSPSSSSGSESLDGNDESHTDTHKASSDEDKKRGAPN